MAKNIAASRQKKPSGLSDKVSDIVLVVICAAIMLIVAYPLYYVLVASFSDPYDVYAGKTFLLPSQFTLKGYQAVFADLSLIHIYPPRPPPWWWGGLHPPPCRKRPPCSLPEPLSGSGQRHPHPPCR